MKHKKNIETFEQFGSTFQDKLATIISRDSSFADQIQEVLPTNFFEHKHLQIYIQKIFDYKTKYRNHPSIDAIKSILGTELEKENEMLVEQIKEFFSNSILSTQKLEDIDYIKDKSLDFCKKQKLKEAMLKSIDLLQKSSFDEISTTINNALKLGNDNNFGHEYIIDFEKRYEDKQRNPISTGWIDIDNITQGGLGQKELGVIIAPPGCGKSFCLVHLTAQAMLQNKNVVYYSLELADEYVARRVDSTITEFPLNDLKLYQEIIKEKIKNITGKLIVKEYPTKSISLKAIRNHLDKLEQRNFIPDMIVLDYGDLLKPISYTKEKRFDLESVFEDLRAMAQERRIPIWTASQCHRDSMEKEVITMASIAESFNKCFCADFIMSLSRTIEDKNANTGRFYIAKNRAGIDGVIYNLFVDTSISKIRIIANQNGMSELVNDNSNNGNEIVQSHKQKYKELLKNKSKKKE